MFDNEEHHHHKKINKKHVIVVLTCAKLPLIVCNVKICKSVLWNHLCLKHKQDNDKLCPKHTVLYTSVDENTFSNTNLNKFGTTLLLKNCHGGGTIKRILLSKSVKVDMFIARYLKQHMQYNGVW